MAIHKIVRMAETMINNYEVKREQEKLEMIYCVGRIESATNPMFALDELRNHLEKHYSNKHGNELFDYFEKSKR